MALDSEGIVYAWGQNSYGEIGKDRQETYSYEVKPINGISQDKIVKIAAGQNMSLVVDEKGKIYTWGNNANYRLGRNTTTAEEAREYNCINILSNGALIDIKALQVAIGSSFGDYGLVLDNEGYIWSWGNPAYGKSGRLNTNPGMIIKVQGTTEVLNPETKEVIDTIEGEWTKGFYVIKNSK